MKLNEAPELDSFMLRTVNRNLLKYAAGQHIFCPLCQDIMDWRRTVIASIYVEKPGETEVLARQFTKCAKCFDKSKENLERGVEIVREKHPDWQLRIETVDGRTISKRR